MPHQIVGQVGIKIKTSITRGKESNPLWRVCLNQDGRANSVNKISLPNLPILFPSLKLNMLQKNKVNVLKNHKTVLKAKSCIKKLNISKSMAFADSSSNYVHYCQI